MMNHVSVKIFGTMKQHNPNSQVHASHGSSQGRCPAAFESCLRHGTVESLACSARRTPFAPNPTRPTPKEH